MYKRKKIAVVMSCWNEEGKIGLAVTKMRRTCGKLVDAIVVVDDGSTDSTAKEAKKAGAIVIRHAHNAGAGAGHRTGFFWTRDHGMDITVLFAGDDQDDASDIKPLIAKVIDEKYDYVHGSRWLPASRRINHPMERTILTQLYSVLFSFVTGFHATDATNGVRAFRTSILRDSRIRLDQPWLNKYELEPYLFYKVIRLGYKVSELPVTKRYHEKMNRNTKMIPVLSWWSILRPLFLLPLGLKS